MGRLRSKSKAKAKQIRSMICAQSASLWELACLRCRHLNPSGKPSRCLRRQASSHIHSVRQAIPVGSKVAALLIWGAAPSAVTAAGGSALKTGHFGKEPECRPSPKLPTDSSLRAASVVDGAPEIKIKSQSKADQKQGRSMICPNPLLCGSWLACDADTSIHQENPVDAFAGKPAPTVTAYGRQSRSALRSPRS